MKQRTVWKRTRPAGKVSRLPKQVNIRLPALHPGQQRVAQSPARFTVLACGRRWGKSVLGVDRLVHPALQGAPVAWMSPTYRMLIEVWRSLKQVLAPLITSLSEQQHRLELCTGGVVEMWSLERPDLIRGRKYRRIVIDEAAMVRSLSEAWQAIIRPTLTDMQGDAWLLSTPRGRGFFWECFQRGQDDAEHDWVSWQLPTWENPHITPEEIAALRRELPERIYRQEIEACFLDDSGGVFRFVAEAATAVLRDSPQPGCSYAMGIDWGRQQDFTVWILMDMEDKAVVAMDRMNQVDYAVQLARLDALCQHWQPDVIIAEQNSIGIPLIEQLQRRGLPVQSFVTTSASKAQAIEQLAFAFEQRVITIPNDPTLLHELLAYEMERLPSGGMRYSAPPGLHDDCVMALALCYSACSTEGSLLLW